MQIHVLLLLSHLFLTVLLSQLPLDLTPSTWNPPPMIRVSMSCQAALWSVLAERTHRRCFLTLACLSSLSSPQDRQQHLGGPLLLHRSLPHQLSTRFESAASLFGAS